MRKLYIFSFILLGCGAAMAQSPEDALKLAWNPLSGTARNMAIGGAMTGLGGEITAAHTNPGGLALYKTSEFVFSPGFVMGKNKTEYRGAPTTTGQQANGFNMGTTGVVLAGGFGRNSSLRGAAISFSANKVADFNNYVSYKGFNNVSSGAERYVEEFSNARIDIGTAFSNSSISIPTRMATYLYLIDTITLGGIKQVVAMPEFTNGVNQENTIKTRGGITEYALSAAISSKDKLFIGGTLGLPYVNFNRDQTYKESDASSNLTNRFGSYTYTESLRTRGLGINLKLGAIYRPVEQVRLGLTVHSPSVYQLKDRYNASMNANTENYNGNKTIDIATINDGNGEIVNEYQYASPWRVAAGFSYVFREVENVKKQRAFIAADVEYIMYRTMRYSSSQENPTTTERTYFEGLSQNIKEIYKNAFNFKLGGEIKFNTIMFRLGGSYMGNPNKSTSELQGNRISLSGGLGYRHRGMFFDVAYVHQLTKDVNFPYRLNDKPNTFAKINGTGGTVMVTAGFKF
jgi:long-subunit fatty acid transport protein